MLQGLERRRSDPERSRKRVRSCDDLEQAGNEVALGLNIISTDVPNLPLPDHGHGLKARPRSSRCLLLALHLAKVCLHQIFAAIPGMPCAIRPPGRPIKTQEILEVPAH
jgi:hypothetical protein